MNRTIASATILGFFAMLAASSEVRAHGLLHIDYVDGQIYIQPAPGPDDSGYVFWDPNEGPYVQFDFASDGILNVANISAGGHLVVGDQISLQVLGPLMYDAGDGSGLTSPGLTSVQVLPFGWTVTGSSGETDPVYWTTVQADGYLHEHYNFSFFNDTLGAYGIEFRVLTSASDILPSQPYILLFNNGLSEEQMVTVVEDFQSVLSPGLLGDLNHDGFVGQDDMNIILGEWGQHVALGTVGDINNDGFIGQDDLNTILSEWGQGTPIVVFTADFRAVPESSSLVLSAIFCLGCLGVWRHRARSKSLEFNR